MSVLLEVVEKHVKPAQKLKTIELPKAEFAFEQESISELKKIVENNNAANGQRTIDLSFLSMLTNGWPTFAIFNLNHKESYLDVSYWVSSKEVRLSCPSEKMFIKKYFQATYEKLFDIGVKSLYRGNVDSFNEHIFCKFNGLVPDATREVIKQNRHKYDEILIIKEADKWQHKETIVLSPPNPDPLVVGVKNEIAVLLDKFDVTPIEHYVASEF